MRTLYLLILATFPLSFAYGQTAEEIISKTESAYRDLSNYADQGTYIRSSGNFPKDDTSTYFLAIDRKGNVNQWLHKGLPGQLSGARYVKTDTESMGTYTRIGSQDASFQCNMSEAGARMMGTGGDVFYVIGSLFYEGYLTGSPTDSSVLRYYDTVGKLPDTMINGAKCYVIKTRKTTVTTQSYADRANFVHDSIFHLLELPVEQRGGPRAEPGAKSTEHKFFIRKSDFVIVRMENFFMKEDTDIVKGHSVLSMNPKYNIQDFANYLKE